MKTMFRWAALAILLGPVLPGCASHEKPQGVADVPESRSAANAVLASEFESSIATLRRKADAYADCMSTHGYALDEERVADDLLHLTQVQEANHLLGDPWEIIERRRQQLRLSPSMWRPASNAAS